MNKIIISLIILFSSVLAARSIPSKNATMYFAPIGSQVFINGDYANTTDDLVVNGSIFAANSIKGSSLIINGATLISSTADFFKNGASTSGTNRSLGNMDAQGLNLITNGIPAITIDNNGSVGIGIASPAARLYINGEALTISNKLSVNGASTSAGIFNVSGAIAIAEEPAPISGTANYGKIYVDSSNNQLYFMDDAGNPTDLVAAAGGGGTANYSLSNLAAIAINTSLISDADNTDDLGSTSIGWKDLWLSGDAHFAQYLYHKGDTDTFVEYAVNGMTANAGGELFISIVENNSQDSIELGNDGDIDIKLSAGLDAAILVNGSSAQVGIGTSNTNAKLTVNGIILLEELGSAPSKTDGFGKIYVNGTTTNICYIDSSGTETDLVNGDGLGATEIDGLSDAIFSGNDTSIYMGSGAGEVSASSLSNTALGVNSQAPINGGDNNTSIGYNSAQVLTSGNGNIAIGYKAGDNLTTGNGNLIIGNDIDAPNASGSNQLNIANLIFATSIDEDGTTVSDGNVGIRKSNPSHRLYVNGTLGIAEAASFNGSVNKVTITPPAASAILTLSNNSSFILSGGDSLTLNTTANSSLTVPSTGTTLATLNGTEFFSNKTLVAPTLTGTATAANITSASGTINGSELVADTKFFFQGTSPGAGKYLQAQGTNGSAAWVDTVFTLSSDNTPRLSTILDANGYSIADINNIAADTFSAPSNGSSINVNLSTNDFKINGKTLVVEGDDNQVGINAVNPAYQLQINGDLGVTGASTLAALNASSGSFTTLQSTGNFTITNSSTFRVLAASGNTNIGGTLNVTGATTLNGFTATSATVNGNITSVNNIAITTLSSENGDNGEAINIDLGSDAGDDFTIDINKLVVEGDTGDVGINKAEPTVALDVVGSGFITNNLTVMGDLLIKDGSASGALNINNDNGVFLFNGTSVGATEYTALFQMDDTGLSIGHDNNDRKLDLKTNSTSRLSISANGDIGIGTTNPASKLSVSSSVDKDVLWLSDDAGSSSCEANPSSSFTWVCSSDSRLKKDIKDSSKIISNMMKFQIKDFTIISSNERSTGVIAQEVQEQFPEMVSMGDNGYLRVETPNQWQLVKALQELKNRNQLLKNIICKDHQEEAVCKDYKASNY